MTKRLSVSDLRLKLRSAKRNGGRLKGGRAESGRDLPDESTGVQGLVCPSCGHVMPLPSHYKSATSKSTAPSTPSPGRAGSAAALV